MKSKFQLGFSLIELSVGSLVTLIAASAVMIGVSSTRSTLKSIHIHERAYEELTNYTNFWKGRIGVSGWTGDGNLIEDDPVTLIFGEKPLMGRVYRQIELLSDGHPYEHYSIKTKITWDDLSSDSDQQKELLYSLYQIKYGQ